jgi:cobalt-zinc-cadmium efflux system protein
MGAGHDHPHPRSSGKTLFLALGLTTLFAVVEAVTGWLANSLALLGDAGHMITDSFALGIAAAAAWLANRGATRTHSFGLGRVEFLAALLNSAIMLLLVAYIVVESVLRLLSPEPVQGHMVTAVAIVGLLVNLLVAWILSRGEKNVNTRGAMLHVMGDLLGSVAAIISGIVISITGWMKIDPILSIFISLLILYSTIRLLREAIHALMDGVPLDMSPEAVQKAMASVPGVHGIHDLHLWSLTSSQPALMAHVVVDDLNQWPAVWDRMRALLREDFGIDHYTLQVENSPMASRCDTPHH